MVIAVLNVVVPTPFVASISNVYVPAVAVGPTETSPVEALMVIPVPPPELIEYAEITDPPSSPVGALEVA